MSAGGEKTRLGSPRFQWQPFTSFEEAAAHTPSARPPRNRLISGAQRSCVRGRSTSVRCTRRRPCHMTPLRGTRPCAWLTRVWHACAWHQTLCRRGARRLMLRAGAANVLLLRWPCLPVAMHTTAAVSTCLARLKAGGRLGEEKNTPTSQNAAAMLLQTPYSLVFLAPQPRDSRPTKRFTIARLRAQCRGTYLHCNIFCCIHASAPGT